MVEECFLIRTLISMRNAYVMMTFASNVSSKNYGGGICQNLLHFECTQWVLPIISYHHAYIQLSGH